MNFKVIINKNGTKLSEREVEGGQASFVRAARAFRSLGAPLIQARNTENGVVMVDPSGYSGVEIEIIGLHLIGNEDTRVVETMRPIEA